VERAVGDYQGNAVINYCNADIPWTRISEHKHFAPWESHPKTLIYREFSRACQDNDIPYYPIRLLKDKSQLAVYVKLAKQETQLTFVGRLGTYRYLDMHVIIAEALLAAETYIKSREQHIAMPAFLVEPLL
jgi:UDP-galactopyranose mutase